MGLSGSLTTTTCTTLCIVLWNDDGLVFRTYISYIHLAPGMMAGVCIILCFLFHHLCLISKKQHTPEWIKSRFRGFSSQCCTLDNSEGGWLHGTR